MISKYRLMEWVKIWIFCICWFGLIAFMTFSFNATSATYDDQERSVNSAGGNRYGDSRFDMEANPDSNADADEDFNIDANPDTYINDDPNFPSNIHSPSY